MKPTAFQTPLQLQRVSGCARRVSVIRFVIAMAALLSSAASGEQISLQSAPPVVVRTALVAGSTDVDPSLTEIRVTFSKPMQDGSWSWSTSEW
jgi:hypothetical protein